MIRRGRGGGERGVIFLHDGDSLPSRDAMLRRKGMDDAGTAVFVLIDSFTGELEISVSRCAAWSGAGGGWR